MILEILRRSNRPHDAWSIEIDDADYALFVRWCNDKGITLDAGLLGVIDSGFERFLAMAPEDQRAALESVKKRVRPPA